MIKSRTFESVAMDWHPEMPAEWAPGHSKTVMTRLKTAVLPLAGTRARVDLDTHDHQTDFITLTEVMDIPKAD